MPRVGDGTGFDDPGIPTTDGLTYREETPENPSGEYKSTPKGKGAVAEPGRNKPFGKGG